MDLRRDGGEWVLRLLIAVFAVVLLLVVWLR
jgi:hypothetical protein